MVMLQMTSLPTTNDNAGSEENVIPVEQEPNLNIEIDDKEPDDDGDIDAELDLYSETDRLKTFNDWPSQFVTPQALAADGFYYTKQEDKARCAYCKVKIGQWVENDVPDVEHRRFSTPLKCKFLLWCKSATRENCASFLHAESNPIDEAGPYGLPGLKESILRMDKFTRSIVLGDRYHNSTFVSVHENYMFYDERLKTFENWPSIIPYITPESLSEAGFFHRHVTGVTTCFHCGGTLNQWHDTDDPWIEHASNFRDCKFLYVMKGRKFIDEIQNRKQSANQEVSDTSNSS